MAFASTYIQSCDEEAIQVQQHNFALELPPNFLRFKSTTFSIVVTNPLRFEIWYLWTQSNEFEASTDSTKRPISLETMIASKLNEYVSQRLTVRVRCPDAAKKAWQERWVKQANKRKQRNFFVSQTSPQ